MNQSEKSFLQNGYLNCCMDYRKGSFSKRDPRRRNLKECQKDNKQSKLYFSFLSHKQEDGSLQPFPKKPNLSCVTEIAK